MTGSADEPKQGPERQLREQVSALGQKFLLRTRDETNVLRELTARLCQGDVSALAQLQEMAHKIHGSGAIFGFSAISECGGEIERLGEQLAAPRAAPAAGLDRDALQCLAQCIERLASAVAAATAAGRPDHN